MPQGYYRKDKWILDFNLFELILNLVRYFVKFAKTMEGREHLQHQDQ